MSGVGLQVELAGLGAVQSRIDRMLHLDKHHLMDAIGAEVAAQTQHRISAEKTAPDGKAWAAWSSKYAKTRTAGQTLLESEGHLLQSITHVVAIDGDAVDVGSNLIYARIQNDGGAEVGKPGLPARQYLGLSESNRTDIAAVASSWLDAQWSGANV